MKTSRRIKIKLAPKGGKKQQTVKMLNARIKELKAKVKEQELTVSRQRTTISLNDDTIAQQATVSDSLTGQLVGLNGALRETIETTAKRMIELDDYNEKVRIAKIAAMNVYGTLAIVQRDLKAVIETPTPDASTPDVMESLLEGDLHLEVPPPTGEVPNMVEAMFNDLGDDAPTAGLGVRNISGDEDDVEDLGLIPGLGEERAASLFPDNVEFTASIPLFGEAVTAVDAVVEQAAEHFQELDEESRDANDNIFVEPSFDPKNEVAKIKTPNSAHLKTRP
jgi:uncharacterized coiled-coil protein SlyX